MPALGCARHSGSETCAYGLFAQGGMGSEASENTLLAKGSGAAVLHALGGTPWARVDYFNRNDFTGATKATGWGAKPGVAYKPAQAWTVGASYRIKSALSEMKTSTTGADHCAGGSFADNGRITVVGFPWPAMTALGASWQTTPDLLVVLDVKRIAWASVLKDFKLRCDSAGMVGSASLALPQNGKDQTAVNPGLSYAVNPPHTLRGGVIRSDNPIPEALVNPLFPATAKSHCALGMGWRFALTDEIKLSLTLAPTCTVTNGMGVVVTHKQTNLQAMYSRHCL